MPSRHRRGPPTRSETASVIASTTLTVTTATPTVSVTASVTVSVTASVTASCLSCDGCGGCGHARADWGSGCDWGPGAGYALARRAPCHDRVTATVTWICAWSGTLSAMATAAASSRPDGWA